ncbi:hypothetical protein ACI65C_009288 [Semiaphis heraclei]
MSPDSQKHTWYAAKYWMCEFMCLANIVLQIYWMNKFFAGEFITYGLRVIGMSTEHQDSRVDPMVFIFPRKLCNFWKMTSLGHKKQENFEDRVTEEDSDATELQQNITKLITSSISKEINKIVIHNNNTLDRETKNAFNSIIHFCNDPFEGLDTEYKFLNTLQTSDFYEKSNIITLDNTIQNVILHNVNTVDEKKTKGVILPLKFQFRKYFEAPDVFDSFMEHHNSLNTESDMTNFINTQLWKEKISLINKGDSILIPYFLYFDDFEINNPLGSHSSSVLGVYYSFPSAPEFLRYSLNSIFVAALFNTKDVKSIGNDNTFFKLVEEINELENIDVNIRSPFATSMQQIYFYLAVKLTDRNCLGELCQSDVSILHFVGKRSSDDD